MSEIRNLRSLEPRSAASKLIVEGRAILRKGEHSRHKLQIGLDNNCHGRGELKRIVWEEEIFWIAAVSQLSYLLNFDENNKSAI